MTDTADTTAPTAASVREVNAELDAKLLELFDQISPSELAADPGTGEWRLHENLGHIAEFPRYFARQLGQWLDGERIIIGRVAEHCPDRNDAIARAHDRKLADLREEAQRSFAELAQTLRRLDDKHLQTPTQNVKYGQEPLSAYLQRYILGHKASHIRQLHETTAALRQTSNG